MIVNNDVVLEGNVGVVAGDPVEAFMALEWWVVPLQHKVRDDEACRVWEEVFAEVEVGLVMANGVKGAS